MITVKAPGKLYIAGEYAIVEPGNPAILIAVDQFIEVQANFQESISSAWSDQSPTSELKWHRANPAIRFNEFDQGFSYVASAIKTTEEYLQQNHYVIRDYHLAIHSALNSQNGRKYGLGSSAAVTVAVVKAICKIANCNASSMTIFKLAAIAHLKVQGNGSLGDVAASVYQGWIAYHSFDRKWLLNVLETHSITAVVKMHWPHLSIERLMPPADLEIMIGWTGTPASTAHLLGRVTHQKVDQSDFYQHFLAASHKCVDKMINGFQNNDLALIKEQIKVNRSLLAALTAHTGVMIETSKLTQLCNIVEQFGGAAKSSGAGGGDCGIAIIDRSTDIHKIIEQWEHCHIDKLNLHVSYHRQEESNDQPSFTS